MKAVRRQVTVMQPSFFNLLKKAGCINYVQPAFMRISILP